MGFDLGLSALPVELQEQIVCNLHPSAAIALKQTSHHFQTFISLDQYDIDEVRAFLQEKETQPHNIGRLACYSCLCLKPRPACIMNIYCRNYIAPFRPYGDPHYYQQLCLECAVNKDRMLPANVVNMASENDRMLFCIACLTLQGHFCKTCRWCFTCARLRVAETYRRDGFGYRIVPIFNCCWKHKWHFTYASNHIRPLKSDRLLRLQTWAVEEFETTKAGPASVEFFDSAKGDESRPFEKEATTDCLMSEQPPYRSINTRLFDRRRDT